VLLDGKNEIRANGARGETAQVDALGGLQVAFGAVESLRRSLSRELGQYGIRVLTLQTGGIPESIPEGSRVASDDHRADRSANDARARRVARRRR
jgi:3-oxoacyl-[acyl-carrier protein] reductase